MNVKVNNKIVRGVDFVIDFATLGEYRVVTDNPRRPVDERNLWARDVEWTSPRRTRALECSLPRVHNRGAQRLRARD